MIKNPPTEAQKEKVIRLFTTTNNNTAPVIAKAVGITKSQSDRIITYYLETLKN